MSKKEFVVYHHVGPWQGHYWGEPETIVAVAFVEAEDLEDLFYMTNTHSRPWVSGADEGVMPMLRSTSVGDYVQEHGSGQWYQVATVGFNKVSEADMTDVIKLTFRTLNKFVQPAEQGETK